MTRSLFCVASVVCLAACSSSNWTEIAESPFSLTPEADVFIFSGEATDCQVRRADLDKPFSVLGPDEFEQVGEGYDFVLTGCEGAAYTADHATAINRRFEVESESLGECEASIRRDTAFLFLEFEDSEESPFDSPAMEELDERRGECERERLAQRITDGFDRVRGSIRIERPCDDLGGFSDIPGLQIALRDDSGQIIAVMEPNHFNGTLSIANSWCSNLYSAEAVPGSKIYEVDVGRRGTFFVDIGDIEIDEDGDADMFSLTMG